MNPTQGNDADQPISVATLSAADRAEMEALGMDRFDIELGLELYPILVAMAAMNALEIDRYPAPFPPPASA